MRSHSPLGIPLAAALAVTLPASGLGQVRDKMSMRYVGKISWTDYLKGGASFSKETFTATIGEPSDTVTLGPGIPVVTAPTVSCDVTFQSEDGTWSTKGPGLFELKFAESTDSTYQFIVACPNAMYQPPHPAAWSHSVESYDQPGRIVFKPGMKTPVWPDFLNGTWSLPNPATDPLNGVTGTISLTWSFCLIHVVNGKRGCNLQAVP